MENELLTNYVIIYDTLCIDPVSFDGKIYSHVLELENEFTVALKPLDIIKRSCIYYGSSYQGKKVSSKQILRTPHKAPIAVDLTNSIYFFPTGSPDNHFTTSWISADHILRYDEVRPKETLVEFQNNKKQTFSISLRSFKNQVQNAAVLCTELTRRMKKMKRRSVQFQDMQYMQMIREIGRNLDNQDF
ncbi:competence protein ComK [Bacillaceae bacterium Marseille-Q3522]|nr:competence protein ComK [Bacillaceae bacterium Marseille-Q3522]